jgi:hypothetical protein
LIGLDPDDANDRDFTAQIEMADGEPVITWKPDLNENGKRNVRVYKTYGSERIGESASWVDMERVRGSEKKTYKFFKVKVALP